jgi:hypothetical protein
MILIGREPFHCLLARRGITFRRTKTSKKSPDPGREAKLDRIEETLSPFQHAEGLGQTTGDDLMVSPLTCPILEHVPAR